MSRSSPSYAAFDSLYDLLVSPCTIFLGLRDIVLFVIEMFEIT